MLSTFVLAGCLSAIAALLHIVNVVADWWSARRTARRAEEVRVTTPLPEPWRPGDTLPIRRVDQPASAAVSEADPVLLVRIRDGLRSGPLRVRTGEHTVIATDPWAQWLELIP